MRLSSRHDAREMVLTAVLTAALAATAHGQQVDVQRLSERVLVLNLPMLGQRQVVAVSAKRGLALIDTGPSPLVATMFKEDVERRFGRRDWAYVINTHGHIDGHANGNGVFADVPIIGHENAPAEIAARLDAVASQRPAFCREKVRQLQERVDAGAEDAVALRDQIAVWRSIEDQTVSRDIMVPTVTFSDRLTIDMGDLTLRLLYFGNGHSASDVVVYIPEEKLLVSGGVCGPYLPAVPESARLVDLSRSISVLDDVLDADVERAVTSHWGILDGQDVRRGRDYLRDLLAGVTSAGERGLSLEQAQAELALDRHFPYMADVKPAQGTRDDAHAANVAAVFKLVDRPPSARRESRGPGGTTRATPGGPATPVP